MCACKCQRNNDKRRELESRRLCCTFSACVCVCKSMVLYERCRVAVQTPACATVSSSVISSAWHVRATLALSDDVHKDRCGCGAHKIVMRLRCCAQDCNSRRPLCEMPANRFASGRLMNCAPMVRYAQMFSWAARFAHACASIFASTSSAH